jgi:hypothetical protein
MLFAMNPRGGLRLLLVALVACVVGCNDDTSSGGGSLNLTSVDGGVPLGAAEMSCAPDPLKTGLIVQQTGVPADTYDCIILKYATQYGEPDPMIFKAIIYVESRFDYIGVGCPNTCGCPAGWAPEECGCLGLTQSIAPACSYDQSKVTFLPNGHPDLATDPSSPDWPGSAFNPDVNIKSGVGAVAGNRADVKKDFPGCTEEQYTLMAIGNFNHYGSTQSCTVYNTAYTTAVLEAYHRYSVAAGYTEHPYP